MNQIEQCPKCKHITEGYPVFETKRQVARTGGGSKTQPPKTSQMWHIKW